MVLQDSMIGAIVNPFIFQGSASFRVGMSKAGEAGSCISNRHGLMD